MSELFLSVVTPVFNEAANLREFFHALQTCLDRHQLRWEWIAVDDGSRDSTPEILRELSANELRVRVISLPQNGGSHGAILRGLHEAKGDAAAMLAADLQDPPEIVPKMLEAQAGGVALVWAARTRPDGVGAWDRFLSANFHGAVRLWTGLPNPKYGADCFLADRRALDVARQWVDPGPNLFLRLMSLPLPQNIIPHERRPRARGRSGWTTMKKLKLAASSLLAYSKPGSWAHRARNVLWKAGQTLAAPGSRRRIRSLARGFLIEHPTPGNHLDVGCGPHSVLLDLGLRPCGVDVDEGRIFLFNRTGGIGSVARSAQLPFVDGAFGTVWSFALLHHLEDGEVKATLSEMNRVTAQGGWMVIFDGLPPRSAWRRPLAAAVRAVDAGAHLRGEDELRALLASHGDWECRRVTYSWNGLEGLFCTLHKKNSAAAATTCP